MRVKKKTKKPKDLPINGITTVPGAKPHEVRFTRGRYCKLLGAEKCSGVSLWGLVGNVQSWVLRVHATEEPRIPEIGGHWRCCWPLNGTGRV